MAKYPYEYASLASWLQPRWVVEAPAQDQSLRLRRAKVTRAETLTWTNLQHILCRRDDVANWHLSLVIAETWKHLKTYAILSICLPTGLCVTSCPNIIVRWCSQPDRSSRVPKYRGKHQSWSCHFIDFGPNITSKIIEMPETKLPHRMRSFTW